MHAMRGASNVACECSNLFVRRYAISLHGNPSAEYVGHSHTNPEIGYVLEVLAFYF